MDETVVLAPLEECSDPILHALSQELNLPPCSCRHQKKRSAQPSSSAVQFSFAPRGKDGSDSLLLEGMRSCPSCAFASIVPPSTGEGDVPVPRVLLSRLDLLVDFLPWDRRCMHMLRLAGKQLADRVVDAAKSAWHEQQEQLEESKGVDQGHFETLQEQWEGARSEVARHKEEMDQLQRKIKDAAEENVNRCSGEASRLLGLLTKSMQQLRMQITMMPLPAQETELHRQEQTFLGDNLSQLERFLGEWLRHLTDLRKRTQGALVGLVQGRVSAQEAAGLLELWQSWKEDLDRALADFCQRYNQSVREALPSSGSFHPQELDVSSRQVEGAQPPPPSTCIHDLSSCISSLKSIQPLLLEPIQRRRQEMEDLQERARQLQEEVNTRTERAVDAWSEQWPFLFDSKELVLTTRQQRELERCLTEEAQAARVGEEKCQRLQRQLGETVSAGLSYWLLHALVERLQLRVVPALHETPQGTGLVPAHILHQLE